ncbi:MAG: hypothetical protein JNK27_15680 [Chitinophagaceae bacterium]|nr:hypothetical protein [Chitinophagaceae bacterium]
MPKVKVQFSASHGSNYICSTPVCNIMKRGFFTLLTFLLLISPVYSQGYINLKRTEVISTLKKKFQPAGNNQATISLLKDTVKVIPADNRANEPVYIYLFDESGRCKSETIMTRCDSCLTGLLQAALAQKKYEWKKINENQYISKFEDKLMIELPPENPNHSFSFLRVEWTRKLYDLLIKD